ncbi:MAG: porin [Pseudomonadaceae bacterium]|nr:porin [Pseudomonadaceae bacterium]
MKHTLLATTAIVLVAANASAVDVELYGQVNKGLFGYDDGTNTDVVVVDNKFNSTRFGLKGAQALDNGLTASVLFESEMLSNPSNGLQQNNVGTQSATPASTTPVNFTERQARVGLSGMFGGVYLGQQSTAIDGVYTQDLAGAADVMGANFEEIGGGLGFRTKGTNALNAAITPNAMTTKLDENRADSIRYDSPIFNGFQGRASVAQGGDMDLGVFYDGGWSDFKVAAAAGAYFNNDNVDQRGAAIHTTTPNADESTYAASVSVAHSSGLAGTVAYSKDTLDNKAANINDPSTWYAKVGYSWDAFEVAADYGRAKDYRKVGNTDKLTSFGLGAQYNLADGVSVAALYRNFDADITANQTDGIDLYGVNMRVKF